MKILDGFLSVKLSGFKGCGGSSWRGCLLHEGFCKDNLHFDHGRFSMEVDACDNDVQKLLPVAFSGRLHCGSFLGIFEVCVTFWTCFSASKFVFPYAQLTDFK